MHHLLLYKPEVVQVAHVHNEVPPQTVSDQSFPVNIHKRLASLGHLAVTNVAANKATLAC